MSRVQTHKKQLAPVEIRDLVNSAEKRFCELVQATGNQMIFKQEALYAMQAMMANEYLASCAAKQPISFKLAMAQIAGAGLTLNPSMGLAYLVPRDGKVIADISYRGLMKIATDTRAVNLIVAEGVYSHDRFIYRGSAAEPVHDFDPFLDKKDRGVFRGVYVKAYLGIGTLLVRAVSGEEILAARDLSSAWANGQVGKKGPWETHFLPMALKTGVKIARKFWPMTSPALENAIAYLNEEGGEGFSAGPVTLEVAARELGVPQVEHDPVIHMPSMSINPHAEMALSGELDVGNSVSSPTPVGELLEQESQPQSKPPARQKVVQHSIPDEDSVEPKVVERIKSVRDRCIKLRSWQGGLDWVASNLTGDAHALATKLFDDAMAAEVTKVA